MPDYRGLGSRGPVTGTADTTGMNAGKWTVAFTPDILAVNVPQFEVYKIVVNGAPGTLFSVFIEVKQWDSAIYGFQNAWDPVQPMLLNPGQSVYFLYSDVIEDNIPPVVTMWLRYDVALGGV